MESLALLRRFFHAANRRALGGIGFVTPLDQVTIVGTRKEVQGFAFNVVTFPVLYDVALTR